MAERRSRWASPVLRTVAAALFLITFLPLVETDLWWVRMLEFPKLQLFLLTVAVMVLLIAWDRRQATIWALLLALPLGYQAWRLVPYSPLYPVQMVNAEQCGADRQFSLLSANVLQSNEDYATTVEVVSAEEPDLFLAMETDARWIEGLRPIEAEFPYRELVPIDNTYGMALYSRLPLSNTRVRYTVEPDIPSILTDVELRSGEKIAFLAIHPRPPLPGKDSGTRDAELVVSAGDVTEESRPVVIAGDLNDVPWSATTRLFTRLAQVLDPRTGRGFYASFSAGFAGMDWPLDHVFTTEEFTHIDYRLAEDIGSDHRPVKAVVCLDKRDGPRLQEPESRDLETLRQGREELGEGIAQQRAEMQAGEDETVMPEAD